jgi:hypothetical protein
MTFGKQVPSFTPHYRGYRREGVADSPAAIHKVFNVSARVVWIRKLICTAVIDNADALIWTLSSCAAGCVLLKQKLPARSRAAVV